MQSLNLFGVQIDQRASQQGFSSDTKLKKRELERTLNDLVALAQQVDPTNSASDFSRKKTFNFYDPYNSTEANHFAALRFDDKARLSASIVVDVHGQNLTELKANKGLSFTDKERLNQIEILMDQLNHIKILDSPVLLKLYNLYRK